MGDEGNPDSPAICKSMSELRRFLKSMFEPPPFARQG